MSDKPQLPMPKYRCHKEVWALKIAKVDWALGNEVSTGEHDGGMILTPEDELYAPFRVDAQYVSKHRPKAGGYFVQYKDGYQSFSPPGPFEEGYNLISSHKIFSDAPTEPPASRKEK